MARSSNLRGAREGLEPTSFVFHFNMARRDKPLPSDEAELLVLERVLRALLARKGRDGSVAIRIGRLLIPSYANGPLEAAWRASVRARRDDPFSPFAGIPLDQILAVVLSGALSAQLAALRANLDRYTRSFPQIFGMTVKTDDRTQEAIYLSRNMTAIGVLHPSRRLELDFGAVEYWPAIEDVLRRHSVKYDLSPAAVTQGLRLLGA